MVSVIPETQWKEFCARKCLPIDSALFVLETCYYGFGWRTRPGTLVVTDAALVHHSYCWKETEWAVFEPSLRIEVPLASISRVVRRQLSLGRRLLLGNPESCFTVETRDGGIHNLVLQKRGKEFCGALCKVGVTLEDECMATALA